MDSIKAAVSENPALASGLAGATSLLVVYLAYRRSTNKPKKVTAPPGTVILHQILRGTRAPSLSPFPLKLETFLRLAKVPYVNDIANFNWSSKGKTPWITLDGVDVADSQLSIRYLNEKLHLDLNKSLTSQQKGVARALQVMVDEHLLWPLAYFRWLGDKEMKIFRENFDLGFPWNEIFLRRFSRKVKNYLHGQGLGRHSEEDIVYFMMEDFTALNNQLGDQKFMMGDEMTEVDCSVFGMLSQFTYQTEEEQIKGVIKNQFPKLLSYCDRIKAELWPDWDQCLKNSK